MRILGRQSNQGLWYPAAPDPRFGRKSQLAGGRCGSSEPSAGLGDGGGPSGKDKGELLPLLLSNSSGEFHHLPAAQMTLGIRNSCWNGPSHLFMWHFMMSCLPIRNRAEYLSFIGLSEVLAETSLSLAKISLRHVDFVHLSAPPFTDQRVQDTTRFSLSHPTVKALLIHHNQNRPPQFRFQYCPYLTLLLVTSQSQLTFSANCLDFLTVTYQSAYLIFSAFLFSLTHSPALHLLSPDLSFVVIVIP